MTRVHDDRVEGPAGILLVRRPRGRAARERAKRSDENETPASRSQHADPYAKVANLPDISVRVLKALKIHRY